MENIASNNNRLISSFMLLVASAVLAIDKIQTNNLTPKPADVFVR
jgi:hypothetical protein